MGCTAIDIQQGHEAVPVGSQPVITALFTDVDDAPTTPTSTTVTTTAPNGSVATYTTPNAAITNPAVGTIEFTFPAGVTAGWWTVTVTGVIDDSDATSTTSFLVEAVQTHRPCQWPIIQSCQLPNIDPEVLCWAEQFAVEVLWAASGRQFGICQTTIRPCLPACSSGAWGGWVGTGPSLGWDPWGRLHAYRAMICGACSADPCSCGPRMSSIELWHKRICSIDRVQIDGVTLTADQYALNGRKLMRLGEAVWPECQDWTVANDEIGSWSVTYTHGRRVTTGGQVAAGILAAELARGCVGDPDCMLPERIQSITRDGVTVGAVLDPMVFLDGGRTGLYIPDLWLSQVNPNRLARRALAFRPSGHRGARVR